MKLLNLKKIAVGMFAGLAIILASNSDANAQSRREIERERQRIERENARYQRDRQRSYQRDRNDRVSTRTGQRIANANYTNGYAQGLQAGQFDRRKGKYNRSNVYRDSGAYPNNGDPTSSDYIYRQGYLQGYNDGFNGIRNY